jgi:hypothetical protein
MTTQSFGFDLLDRMMGSRGHGCDTACCETPACPVGPTCGCEAPSCDSGCAPFGGGLLSGLCGGNDCCAAEPACGCEPTCGIAAPACGCEVASCDSGCGHKRGGLLSRLFRHHGKSSCDAACCESPCAEPACGCEPTCGIAAGPACGCDNSCDSGCGHAKRGGLLSRLFGGHKSSSCCDMGCDTGCGCGTPAAVPYSSPAPSMHSVPEAPAPIVDPSASIQSKRRVVQASARYVR